MSGSRLGPWPQRWAGKPRDTLCVTTLILPSLPPVYQQESALRSSVPVDLTGGVESMPGSVLREASLKFGGFLPEPGNKSPHCPLDGVQHSHTSLAQAETQPGRSNPSQRLLVLFAGLGSRWGLGTGRRAGRGACGDPSWGLVARRELQLRGCSGGRSGCPGPGLSAPETKNSGHVEERQAPTAEGMGPGLDSLVSFTSWKALGAGLWLLRVGMARGYSGQTSSPLGILDRLLP